MKQLTVYCSLDIEDDVISILDKVGADGFMRVGGTTGNKFLPHGQVPRVMTWEGSILVVPNANDEVVESVVQKLGEYVGKCDVEPCLRFVVTPVEEGF